MSEPENFLGRWSRRKLEAEQDSSARPRESGDPEPHHHETAEPIAPDSRHEASEATPSLTAKRGDEQGRGSDDNKETQSDKPKEKGQEPAFDIASLPSIDSITAASDVRMFLQKGVPAELTRAALRRAWAADPAIRDFIGIAENQYDFATGSDLPGFGALDVSADDIRRMVADVFGGIKVPDATESPTTERETGPGSTTAEPPVEVGPSETCSAAGEPVAAQPATPATKDQMASYEDSRSAPERIVHRNEENIATQQSIPETEPMALPGRRSHGRATPQ